MANTALNRTGVALLTNKSGGAVAQGDVVIVDSGTAVSFTTTTTVAYIAGTIGVVLEPNGIASNGVGLVALAGYVPKIKLSGAASLGDLFKTHSVAGQAVRHGAPAVVGDFGQVLGTGAAPAAILWGTSDKGGGGGSVATDTIWDAAGDLVQGTGADAAARLALGTAFQILRVNSGATAVEYAGGLSKIAETVVGAGGAASVDFDNIPGTYRHLELRATGRGAGATESTSVIVTFNNDGGNHYDLEIIMVYGATLAAIEQFVQGAFWIGDWAAASGAANSWGASILEVNDYAGSIGYKAVLARCANQYGTTAGKIKNYYIAGLWRNTAAITRIILASTSGNFIEGSVFTLYGLN